MFGLATTNRIASAEDGIDDLTPITGQRYVVMDSELTGLDPRKDSIVSLGAVAMEGGRILMGETFYEMMRPRTSLTGESVVVHGIVPSEVSDKPRFGELVGDFLEFCRGAVVVGHFLSLDLKFLNKELKQAGRRPFRQPAADTLQLHEWLRLHKGDFSRHYNGSSRNVDLFSIVKQYGIPVSEAHHALMDAFITAQLFQRFLDVLPELGVGTIKELLKIGKP